MNIILAIVAVVAAAVVAWIASIEMRVQAIQPWAESKFARKRRSKKVSNG